jgi:hypothetical protein
VRKRFSVVVVAVLLVALGSVTLVTRASGSSPGPARATPLTITPIQQMSLDPDQEGSSAARIGAKVGQVPGFCRLHA